MWWSAGISYGNEHCEKISMEKEGGRRGSLVQDAWSIKMQGAGQSCWWEHSGDAARRSPGWAKCRGQRRVTKKTGTCTIWYNRREDGKHQQGVIFAGESQTVKALIKIILSIRWHTLIYVLGGEERLLCKGCAAWAAEVGIRPGDVIPWGRVHVETGLTCRFGRLHIPVWKKGDFWHWCDLPHPKVDKWHGRGRPKQWGKELQREKIIWKITGDIYIIIYIFIPIQGQINKPCKALELHWNQIKQFLFAQRAGLFLGQKD